MVSIKSLDIPVANIQDMLVKKATVDLTAYVDAFKKLSAEKCLEIVPGDDKMRKVKMNVTSAAKVANVAIEYGETAEKTLIVWLKDDEPKKARKSRKLALVS